MNLTDFKSTFMGVEADTTQSMRMANKYAPFYQKTRTHDDQCHYKERLNQSRKPVKYHTYVPEYLNDQCQNQIIGTVCSGINKPGPVRVNKESDLLRGTKGFVNTATRYREALPTSMYATQPFQGTGDHIGANKGYLVDVSSMIRPADYRVRKPCSELSGAATSDDYVFHVLPGHEGSAINMVYPVLENGMDSRTDFRNAFDHLCRGPNAACQKGQCRTPNPLN